MIERTYKCNFCRDMLRCYPTEGFRGVGLYYAGGRWTIEPWRDVENHICFKCLSSFQDLPRYCGHGIKDCKGGRDCKSDHK